MKTKYENSLKYKISQQIDGMSGNVILRSDLKNLGSYRQISRILALFVKEKKLAKISFGIYAKTFKSEYTGNYILQGGFMEVALVALNRLSVKYGQTQAQKAYNEGKTTQIPVKPIIRLKSRCRRLFSYKNTILRYEDGIYAK
jgi:hypothetical protein